MGLVRLCALVAVSIFAGSIEASEFKPEFRFNHTAETPRLEIAWTVEEAPRGFKYVYDVLEWLTEDDDDPGLWFLVYEGLEADVGFELVAYERSGAPQRFGRVVRRLVPINTPRTKPATFAVRDWWVNICDT